MEADITTYAASYVLVRIALLCALGYAFFRVLARSRATVAEVVETSKDVELVHVVPEDRC